MIDYDGGRFQICFAFQLYGSVFPRAMILAVPAAIAAAIIKVCISEFIQDFVIMTNNAAYASFSFVVAFLLTFRTGVAYSHFWEGTTLMQLLRGQWVGAFSSLLAFSSTSTEDAQAVENFRHKLMRLFSLLHCTALQYVATMKEAEEEFAIVGVMGLDDTTVRFIHRTPEDTKIFVTIQWIQQLIICNLNSGILPVPAPIVSRVFQDLSTGIVTLNNARKISDTPFLFPYAQTMTCILLIHLALTPFVVATWCDDWPWAACFAFVPVFAFWSINFIASEIEQPFGSDANDINVGDLQDRFNRCLVAMLDPQVSHSPTLKDTAIMDRDNLLGHADTLDHAYSVSMGIADEHMTRAEPAHEVTRQARWQRFQGAPHRVQESSENTGQAPHQRHERAEATGHSSDPNQDPNQESHPCPNDSSHQEAAHRGHFWHLGGHHGAAGATAGHGQPQPLWSSTASSAASRASSGGPTLDMRPTDAPAATQDPRALAPASAVAQDPRVVEPKLSIADAMLCAGSLEEAPAEASGGRAAVGTRPLTALALALQGQAYPQRDFSAGGAPAQKPGAPAVTASSQGGQPHSSNGSAAGRGLPASAQGAAGQVES